MTEGYYEVSELAEEWGVTNRNVQKLCSQGKIPGAIKIGRSWKIPVGAKKPEDERVGTGEHRYARLKAKGEIPQADKDNLQMYLNLSKDIRSSLYAIMGNADLIRKHLGDKEKNLEYLENIQNSGKDIETLLENIVRYVRFHCGMVTVENEIVDICQITDGLIEYYHDRIRAKKIDVEIIQDIEHRYVYADLGLLIPIFKNLLDNEVKFVPEGGKIRLSHTERTSRIPDTCIYQFSIEDNGRGMSKELVDQIFNAFMKSGFDECDSLGPGLGLPIVKETLSILNGRISIESELGKGTKISVTIPFKIADASKADEILTNEIDPERLKGKRVLIAEDNTLNREVAAEIFEEEGFIVETAVDGAVCAEMVAAMPAGYYDLVLMDIMMPRMDGIRATEMIRTLGDREKAGVPIVAMTANVTPEEQIRVFEAGMNGFIGKPINMHELYRILNRVL